MVSYIVYIYILLSGGHLNMKKKIISLVLAVVMIAGMLPLSVIPASAAETIELTSDKTTWTDNNWYFAPAGYLELDEVTVVGGAWLFLVPGCELVINGGIRVNEGDSLVINGETYGEGMGTLIVNGGSNSAGIGGGDGHNGGTIMISGGNITANGGDYAAGIGGGKDGDSGTIMINGGNITANGGDYAAGIGGGKDGDGGTIMINGGTVTAKGGYYGAGIGGGAGGSAGTVEVSSGYMVAIGGVNGAGIGGGYGKGGGSLTVTGGKITAAPGACEDGTYNPAYAIGMGAGEKSDTLNCGKFPVSEGVTLYDADGSVIVPALIDYSGSGTGCYILGDAPGLSSQETVSFYARNVGETFPYLAYDDSTGKLESKTVSDPLPLFNENNVWSSAWYIVEDRVTIKGRVTVSGDVNLILKDGCELYAVDGITIGDKSSLTIFAQSELENVMGALTANGGDRTAGIGGGDGHGGNITICGGIITANGGRYAAGIGGGDEHNGGNITICGGFVTANGGINGAGIGGGDSGHGGTVNIYGGSVTANGGNKGAGIGGGFSGSGGNVTICSGTVNAAAGENDSPAIGRGGGNYGFQNNGTLTVPDDAVVFDNISQMVCLDQTSFVYSWQDVFALASVSVTVYTFPHLLADGKVVTEETASWTTGCYIAVGTVMLGSVTVSGNVFLILRDECDLATGSIHLNKGSSLTIISESNGEKMGSLTANGGTNEAGIGESENRIGGNIMICGGKITSTGDNAPGISGGNITVCGGTVTANGGDYAAGIGGGNRYDCGNITVCGGTVTANGGMYGAGIGGGYRQDSGNVTVSGGNVTAKGGFHGAGIGGGDEGSGGTLTVSGGYVVGAGGIDAAGIGGGMEGHGATLAVSGGRITAIPGEIKLTIDTIPPFAIGMGADSVRNNPNHGFFPVLAGVTLYDFDDSVIVPLSGNYGGGEFYIYGGEAGFSTQETVSFYARNDGESFPYLEYNTSNKEFETKYASNPFPLFNESTVWSYSWYIAEDTLTFDDTITVKGDVNLILKDGCKLEAKGGIAVNEGNSLTIYAQSDGENMGSLIATGASGAAGIGGAAYTTNAKITIHGGNITATGSDNAAGIGGGDHANGNVTIYGGDITATGGESGAGIGSGTFAYSDSNITIYNGTITATGSDSGAGIGGGYWANGGKVTVYDGKITATGVHGAGIGGGFNGYGSDFTFSDGSVTAYSEYAAGIGAGEDGGASNGEFNVADGSIVKAGNTAADSFVTTAATYAQNRYKFASVHIHDYTGEYKNNGNGTHSRQCVYCDVFATSEHTFVNHICVCGATSEHSFTGDYVDNGNGTHSRKCTGCDEYAAPENHTFTYTVNDSTVTAKCSCCDAEKSMTLAVPEFPIYDGSKKTAALEGKDEFVALTGAAVGNILYSEDGGSTYSENAPVNTGNYYVKAAVADKELTAQFTIRKAGLTADDFTFILPAKCEYDGQPKQASAYTEKEGVGVFTLKYRKQNGDGWDTATTDAPTEIGKYRVVISVEEGENYAASAADITNDSWVFEITGTVCEHEHSTVSYVWGSEPRSCTASLVCDTCHTVLESETLSGLEISPPHHVPAAKCTERSYVYFTAEFENELFGTAESEKEYFDPGPHSYVEYVCEYCGDELFDDAKKDAIKAIHAAADRSEDSIVSLLAKTAEDEIEDINTDTVAKVIAIRNRYVSAIEKLTGEAHEHTFSDVWSHNELVHWHESTCEHDDLTKNMAAHTFDENGKCTVCGYEDTGIRAKVCTVILTSIDEPDTVLYSGTTDGTNICNIANVANGTYLMSVSCEGAVTRTYTTEITDGRVTQEVALYAEGDVNGDGEINANDYALAVNTALGAQTEVAKDLTETADYQKAVADLDGDGFVDVLDIALLERKIF